MGKAIPSSDAKDVRGESVPEVKMMDRHRARSKNACTIEHNDICTHNITPCETPSSRTPYAYRAQAHLPLQGSGTRNSACISRPWSILSSSPSDAMPVQGTISYANHMAPVKCLQYTLMGAKEFFYLMHTLSKASHISSGTSYTYPMF